MGSLCLVPLEMFNHAGAQLFAYTLTANRIFAHILDHLHDLNDFTTARMHRI